MWFRCERQMTIPIDGHAALFLIRVYMQPLRELFEDPEKKQRVIDAVNSMSNAVLDYKGFGYIKEYFSKISS